MTSNFQDDLIRRIKQLEQIIEQNLTPRITNIENYLSTLTEKVQTGSVIVTSAFTTEKITPLNISELELIEVYNNVPKVLLKNSIIAELTAKSYREDNQNQPVLLEKDENGKYWIIVSNQNNIFLLPSINIKLHIHKLKTVEKLFDFRGITPTVDTHFLLIKPARVSSLPSGKEWKLLEKGILEFTNDISGVSFRSYLDIDEQQNQVKNNLEKNNLELEKINNELDELKLHLQQLQEVNKNLPSQLNAEINIPEIKDNQANTNLEILKINKQLNELKLELKSEFDKISKSQIQNISKDAIYEQLDNFKSMLEKMQEERNNLETQIGKIAVLRDYVYLQIDLIKVRLEYLENKQDN
ncbi:hypothetical protein SR1949_03190 [Sphaerospermopsis reniformis]|uniref:Uncharacterized protein n=1 Tax=Sphaerospermopsis reniformis TaxID=531300 RepID=A0A479ZRW1_9CYAN|nr:hypothetical protein [Sphaerospermopsis reniformis]GCL35227.1 hypothetical protein SR1949_03190 [Sphaerospermopsis reniformis]